MPEVKLNKVDSFIKAMMLAYPTQYPTRMAALTGMFIHRNGNHWDSDGCVYLAGVQLDPSAPMNYFDLEEEALELARRTEANASECLVPLYRAQGVDLKRRVALRKLIENDINVYASAHVTGDNEKYGVEWLNDFNPEYSLAFEASRDVDQYDREWINAAEEAMSVAKIAIWRGLHMYSNGFSREKANPVLLAKYDKICAILKALEPVNANSCEEQTI